MKHVILVGNGMTSFKLCEKLRKLSGDIRITVYGEEIRPAYDRVHLSEYFAGKTADDLLMAPRGWYHEQGITLHTGELVTEIDRTNKTIRTHHGITDHYDYLVLATGSGAFVPPLDGVALDGVFVYRTIEDLNQIIEYGQRCRTAAVLGGGLLGLEAAKALVDLNLEAHVVEFAPRLMPRQLDEAGATILAHKLTQIGITIHTGKATKRIAGEDRITGLEFADGTALPVEMLVISAGIRPRDEVAKACGLAVHARGGIQVDDYLRTTDEHIFAIGEAAIHNNMIYGLVAPGYDMADVVARQLTGDLSKKFMGFDMSTKLKLLGVDVGSFGDPFGETPGSIPIAFQDRCNGVYKRINISADRKHLLGGILVGDASQYNIFHQMVVNKIPLPAQPETLIIGVPGKEDEGAGVKSLPDTAQICSCENITKGDLICQIKDKGARTIDDLKKTTKACTGCGGCTPLVNDVLKMTLESLGVVVKKTLCEHFAFTRQDLYDIIKVEGIRTYDALLDKHGIGDGCEICKPAVASLLASIWNEVIAEQATIQDTNDRFLANIQRGGTYSVVPRIAGGEITPKKLMAIGRIAEKYNLYTKITGGQRIDMFGAQVHELPLIWEELIQEGFESGHAYGKSLRTIKSCVGSTWCRFGVQDSVSFAVFIENRYKGLRAPHKFKGAVSGCIRECAEAQSKDFGIIATEKGWNLYVCGNGGARPQHAKLLVTDVDTDTCVRLIDRFLMYYIKTADPLTRTATWLNKMEGGLEHLRQVVVEDSLGIGAMLEKEMKELMANYECEWKKVVETPALRAQYRHFVNDDASDDTLSFVDLRGQKMPADWNRK
ncbi:nitrite reductase large subunit NirB [Parachryseolinea silvisoli]|uniref:nitrite reductase large subunit NirB n=1 Tax=Parachryseolinea silvisoli TaxID=2873601 RepID=UPI0022659596|nr:nitrite reductase large subunit NirB [Parachryseolinea silvisoli]MCD9015776.1 nitrite reductase large subunit NirB [Parachryseolinea silvisoli]